MLPPSIQRKLSALRLWEAFLRVFWGAARWLLIVLVLLLAACAVDWVVDRFIDTPWSLRFVLTAGQLVVAVAAAAVLVFWPLVRRLSDSELALLVESKHPELKHRLISAVQFHRPGARIEGMSRELIARVTDEAQQQTAAVSFAAVADSRRLLWGAALAAPPLLVAVLLVLTWPETMFALVARQALLNVEVPRSIYLTADNPQVWPKGEDVVLRFRARGPGVARLTDESRGLLLIHPEGLPSEPYVLRPEGRARAGEAVFAATIPGGYSDFTYRAWLSDGRSDRLYRMKFVPRPVIENIEAWTLLPGYVGTRPSGKPFEVFHPRGEVVAIPGSSMRIRIKVQKPVRKATLVILGPPPALKSPGFVASVAGTLATGAAGGWEALVPALAGRAGDDTLVQPSPSAEDELRVVNLGLLGDGSEGEAVTDIPTGAAAYRLIVEDEHGFKNIPAPRRSVRIAPEDPPQIALLPEQFPPDEFFKALQSLEEYYVDGAPVPTGSRFRIAYTCSGSFGLGAARLHYRILKRPLETGESSPETGDTPWVVVPLKERKAGAAAFDLRSGAFVGSPENEQVEFHALPSPDPEHKLGRTQGGGRFDIELKKLADGQGGFYEPQPGDQIEYFIEVFADRDPDAGRPSARSEHRLKMIVTPGEAVQWVAQALQEESRIRQLEKKQTSVFGGN